MAKRPTDPKPSDVVPAAPPEAFTYKGKRYRLHWLARLFPPLQGTAFARLVESIRVHGLQQAIVVMGDIIVDGANRFLAALQAGVELRFKELPPGVDPVDYIETANMDRRDLTTSQRAAIGAEIRQYRKDRTRVCDDQDTDSTSAHGSTEPSQQPIADDRSGTGQPSLPLAGHDSTVRASSVQPASHPPPDPVRSDPDGADRAGDSNERIPTQKAVANRRAISEAQLRKAERVKECAPELSQAVVHGKISVHDAFEIREEPPEVRAQALADVEAGHARTLKQAIKKKRQATADTAGQDTGVRTTGATDSTAGDDPVASVQSEGGPRRQDVEDVPTDPGASREAADGRHKAHGPTANPVIAKPEAADAPAAADAEPQLPRTSPAVSDEQRDHPVVESSGIVVAPEIARFLNPAFGPIDVAFCSAAAMKHGVQVRHREDPTLADLSKQWRGCMLLVPPVNRLADFAHKLRSELTAGRVQRAAVLAPLDPAVDLLLDAEQLDLFVLERRAPPAPGSRIGAAQTPRTALFLFGVPNLTSDFLATLAPWGHALLPAVGKRSQKKTILTDIAASASGFWGRITNSGGTSPE